MRVLHLPVNWASRSSHTVRGLRQKGIDARGIVLSDSAAVSSDGLRVINISPKRYPIGWLRSALRWMYHFVRSVEWSDLIHWYCGVSALPWGLDLATIKYLRKPAIVEWQGSDIRVPEVEFKDNPYYAVAFGSGYEYRRAESLEKSCQRQKRFAKAGFSCAAPVGMLQYVQKDLFPEIWALPRRLMLSDYQPVFPRIDVAQPVVIHSPTAPVAKGTSAVLTTVEHLKTKYDFEFHLVQGMPRDQALQFMKNADILLDQFVLGDFGSSSLEAMALGKVVVCYIKPAVAALYPHDLPVVNATQDNLSDVLEQLIRDGELRNELGRRGRAYVAKYHNAVKIADRLKTIYSELLEREGNAHQIGNCYLSSE